MSSDRSALLATYLGANGWLLDFGGMRVLVDPWFTGPLSFGLGGWLLKGELSAPQPVPDRLDLLLLSQGLPDHCHPPSLALLPKDVTVLASHTAAKQARRLGFTRIIAMAPRERHPEPPLTVIATAGAAVPQLENGWLMLHPAGSVYIEPHGFPSDDLPSRPLTAVITPVLDVGLPLAGAFVRGRSALPELLRRFQPATVLASTTGGDVRFSGVLSSLLRVEGSPAEAAALIAAQPSPCQFIDPEPGVAYTLCNR
ncbi:MAG: MBL fold metallo-hydrolase [Cyanobacteriota bacterium]|nr:MBL fold metallo-hydrolase [Cyanobacteriota bacterium]